MKIYTLAILDQGRLETKVFNEYINLRNWVKENIQVCSERDDFLNNLKNSNYAEYDEPGDDDFDGDLKMVAQIHIIS